MANGRPRLLWVAVGGKPINGIPFRFVRLLPRIFGVEILAVWRHEE